MPEHTMPASERALADARQAVERRRGLVAGDSGPHLADLGRALLDLASLLTALSQRHGELVRVLTEAVAVVRRLDAAKGGLHWADPATLLTMLAGRGHAGPARPRGRARPGGRRHPPRAGPDRPRRASAGAGGRVGQSRQPALSELGDHDGSLACFREAVQLRRRFAADHPGLGESELASVLADLGIALGDAGRREEAVAALREALKWYWRLPGADSDQCRIEYWAALVAIIHELTELGREDDARSYLDHAEAVYHRLGRSSPDAVAFLTEALRQRALAVGDDGLIRRAPGQAAPGG